MVELFSQYASGVQFTAGAIAGSATGVSGINPIVDRLNSISTDNNLITGSYISGTNTEIYGTSYGDFIGSFNGTLSGTNTNFYGISNGETVIDVGSLYVGSASNPVIVKSFLFPNGYLTNTNRVSLDIDIVNTFGNVDIGSLYFEYTANGLLAGSILTTTRNVLRGGSIYIGEILLSSTNDHIVINENIISTNGQLLSYDISSNAFDGLSEAGSLNIYANSNISDSIEILYKAKHI